MAQRSNQALHIPSSAEIRAERRRIQKKARRRRIACLVVCVLILLLATALLIVSLVLRPSVSQETGDVLQTEESMQTGATVSTEKLSSPDEAARTESAGEAEDAAPENATDVTESEPESSDIGTVSVNSYLNVRSGGSLDDEIIGHLLPEDQVVVIEEENGWYKVVVSEIVGYVCGDYLYMDDSE